MKLRGMKYKVLHVPAFSSYFSSLNLYFYVSTLSVNRVGLGRLHLLTIQISLNWPGPCRGNSYHRNTPDSRPRTGSYWSSSPRPLGREAGWGRAWSWSWRRRRSTWRRRSSPSSCSWSSLLADCLLTFSNDFLIFYFLCLMFTLYRSGCRFTRRI